MINPQAQAIQSNMKRTRYAICFTALAGIIFFICLSLSLANCEGGCFDNYPYSWPCSKNETDYCCKSTFSPMPATSCGTYSDCMINGGSCSGFKIAAWIFGVLFVIGIISIITLNCLATN